MSWHHDIINHCCRLSGRTLSTLSSPTQQSVCGCGYVCLGIESIFAIQKKSIKKSKEGDKSEGRKFQLDICFMGL